MATSSIAVRSLVTFLSGYDHRLIDGAMLTHFIAQVRKSPGKLKRENGVIMAEPALTASKHLNKEL